MSDSSNKKLKIILLGDSAVGKSKLVERFLVDGYQPQQQSTHALSLFKYMTQIDDESVEIDFWDTAGQERFNNVHASYYHQAHACIFVFDVTRKLTYKNLEKWYLELQNYRGNIPSIVVANKIDCK
jgi:Rab-like protein 2